MTKFITDPKTGKKVAVWFTAPRDGWPAQVKFDSEYGHSQLVCRANDYGFIHGGRLYQEACRKAWELFG